MSTVAGFDRLSYHRDLLLCLQLREGDGTMTQDWAKPYHPMTLGGAPAWTHLDNDLTVLEFVPATFDEISCPGADSADLDFTSGDFTLAAWAYHDDVGSAHVIFNRGSLNTCGWEWYTAMNNLALRTNQLGSREGASGIGCITTGEWQFLATVRTGLTAAMYLDGEPWANTVHTANGLLDPVACGVQTFYVGNNPHTNYFDGKLWNARIWNRALGSNEIAALYEIERDLIGV
jgi:hypothetical protein